MEPALARVRRHRRIHQQHTAESIPLRVSSTHADGRGGRRLHPTLRMLLLCHLLGEEMGYVRSDALERDVALAPLLLTFRSAALSPFARPPPHLARHSPSRLSCCCSAMCCCSPVCAWPSVSSRPRLCVAQPSLPRRRRRRRPKSQRTRHRCAQGVGGGMPFLNTSLAHPSRLPRGDTWQVRAGRRRRHSTGAR